MAAGVSFKMTGHKELMRKLHSMDRKMRRSISTKAVRAGAKVMLQALRSAAPRKTPRSAKPGWKALGTKIKSYRGARVIAGITGERLLSRRSREKGQKSKFGGPHFHLIEYGTAERRHTGERAARREGNRLLARSLRTIQSKISQGQRIHRSERAVADIISKGKRTGRVTPRPFFERTFRANVARQQSAQIAVLRREIEAAARAS